MKITVPIDVWDPSRGGLERYLSLLADSLAERGHDVKILCRHHAPLAGPTERAWKQPLRGRVLTEIVNVPRSPRWLRELLFAKRTVEQHRREARDVLFAVRHALEADIYQPHGGSFRAASENSLAHRPRFVRLGKRVLRWLRPSYHVLCWLDGKVFQSSPPPVTLSLSGVVEENLRSAYPEVVFRLERIYNGIPLETFHDRDRTGEIRELRQRFGIPEASRIALFLAHQFRAKGLAHAIRALSMAASWHLVVGGRDRPARYRKLALTLGLEARVHFAGSIADARSAYAGSDAFVLPTYYDSCSLSVLESLACGTPAVTTERNGASELMVDGREGFVLRDPSDESGLAGALGEIAASWDTFHRAALDSAQSFSWADHVERIEQVLLCRLAEKERQR